MNSLATLDRYATRYDSRDSIGYEPATIIGFEDFEDDDEDIGSCPIVETMVGVEFNYQTAQQASALSQSVEASVTSSGKKPVRHSKGYNTIRDINNHPATNAVLSAAAAVAPYGTIVAGAVKLGLSVAQGVLAMVDKFRRSPKERAKRAEKRFARRASRVERRAQRRAKKGKSTKRQERRLARIERRKGKKMSRLQKIADETRAQVAEAPKVLTPENRAAALNLAGEQLGEVMKSAAAGDKVAKAGLVAVQFLGDKAVRESTDYLKAVAKGLPGKEAAALAKSAAKLTDADWKKVVSVAKKASGGVKTGINFGKVRKVAQESARILAKRTNRAAQKRGKMKGLLVPAVAGKVRDAKGGTEQASNGLPGVLVLDTGRAVSGRWRV